MMARSSRKIYLGTWDLWVMNKHHLALLGLSLVGAGAVFGTLHPKMDSLDGAINGGISGMCVVVVAKLAGHGRD